MSSELALLSMGHIISRNFLVLGSKFILLQWIGKILEMVNTQSVSPSTPVSAVVTLANIDCQDKNAILSALLIPLEAQNLSSWSKSQA